MDTGSKSYGPAGAASVVAGAASLVAAGAESTPGAPVGAGSRSGVAAGSSHWVTPVVGLCLQGIGQCLHGAPNIVLTCEKHVKLFTYQ